MQNKLFVYLLSMFAIPEATEKWMQPHTQTHSLETLDILNKETNFTFECKNPFVVLVFHEKKGIYLTYRRTMNETK